MTTVIISYNDVSGFLSGWHGDQRLFICANDAGMASQTGEGSTDRQRAGCVMHRICGTFYRGSVPVENVQQFFVYAGLNAFEGAIAMAKDLWKKCPTAKVTVVSCHCDSNQKQRLLRDTGVGMIPCVCGGHSKLGEIAREALQT